ncbi:glutathione S-transferase N-terminal domain-containing protein [Pacificimonas sp. WHA3]|uniref:Glutathione S-transferase N-terminal domain-containing protein n=1 Tax=Pacificimonas pallii TaxID=2827236 RepID=A0ABS6SCI2_9SPHN|nr:glutathione S-transferase [Pacificimonas pallii]MBV7256132.1 glutathione S-transferase N-terminal domain-containing protein [Pacificimonas pallii]
MSTYQLYCFADSGNSYKVALFLECAGLDWTAHHIDYFGGETHSLNFRETLNSHGECPVLTTDGCVLTQSGAILTFLAEREGVFGWQDDGERYEILRWILFDNHRFTANIATYRFATYVKPGALAPDAVHFIRTRLEAALAVVEKTLSVNDYIAGTRAPTIADLSMSAYLLYTPEQHGLELERSYPSIHRWLERMRGIDGWKPPHALMP